MWKRVCSLVVFFIPLFFSSYKTVLAAEEHPRLFFGQNDIAQIRIKAQTTHAELWQPILSFSKTQLGVAPPSSSPPCTSLDTYRNAGNQLIDFAFTYIVTNDRAYLDLTRNYLLAYANWQYWGDEGGCGQIDLGFDHMVLGNAIAYDWIYNDLNDNDRQTIRTNLIRRTDELYQASSQPYNPAWTNWWRQVYTQNHHWTAYSALGTAALTLEGADSRSSTWLQQAVNNITRDSFLTEGIKDGSWHEGIPYQNYQLTMSLPFMYVLRRMKGVDLFPKEFLKNYPYWRMYNFLPNSSRFAISMADFDWSWGDAYDSSGILRLTAALNRDGHAEWLAQQLNINNPREANIYTAPWYVFEFFYYDPTVIAVPPTHLPLQRTFPDLEGVIWKSGWGNNDVTFALKTGAPGGRFAFDRFTNGFLYPYEVNNSVQAYHAGHDHQDANSFYLYKGNVDLSSETVVYGGGATSLHNTLLVDGKGQFVAFDTYNGRNYWGTDPLMYKGTDGHLEKTENGQGFDYLISDATNTYKLPDSTTGYPQTPMLSEYRRRVLFVHPNYFLVVDTVKAASVHQYDSVLHFTTSVGIEGDWIKGISTNNQILGVKILAPGGFKTEPGNDGKPWIKIRPGSNVAETRFVTVLYPLDTATWSTKPLIQYLGDNGQLIGVRVNSGGTQNHLIRYQGSTDTSLDDYLLDGQGASIFKDTLGAIQKMWLLQGKKLADNQGQRVLIDKAVEGTVEAVFTGAGLELNGQGLTDLRIYGPNVNINQVKVNGQLTTAAKNGDYVTLGAAASPAPSSTPTPKPGDANGDGKVDGIDYVAWLANYGKTVVGGSTKGDFDNNGKVDGLDYVTWLIHYGK